MLFLTGARLMSSGAVKKRCYYEVLEVPRNADAETLKRQCVANHFTPLHMPAQLTFK